MVELLYVIAAHVSRDVLQEFLTAQLLWARQIVWERESSWHEALNSGLGIKRRFQNRLVVPV